MDKVFITLLNMSITASIVALVVILMRLILKKAPKWIMLILWALVAFRLICPFTIESALSIIPKSDPIKAPVTNTQISENVVNSQNNIYAPVTPNDSLYIKENVTDKDMPIVPIEAEKSESYSDFDNFIKIAGLVWISGLIGMLIYAAVSYVRIKRNVREATKFEDNIYYCDHIPSPFILGLVKPKIFVPSNIIKEDFEYVIAHEKAHLKRLDHLWKPFGFLLLSIYWFNPILWVAYVLLCRDIELACDEKVIKSMGYERKVPYSNALVNASVPKKRIAACPLAFGEVGIKGRIKSVLNYKKPAFWIIVISLLVCVIVAVLLLTNPLSDKKGIDTSTPDETVATADEAITIDSEIYTLVNKNTHFKEYVSDANVYYYEVFDDDGKIIYTKIAPEGHRLTVDSKAKDVLDIITTSVTGDGMHIYYNLETSTISEEFTNVIGSDGIDVITYSRSPRNIYTVTIESIFDPNRISQSFTLDNSFLIKNLANISGKFVMDGDYLLVTYYVSENNKIMLYKELYNRVTGTKVNSIDTANLELIHSDKYYRCYELKLGELYYEILDKEGNVVFIDVDKYLKVNVLKYGIIDIGMGTGNSPLTHVYYDQTNDIMSGTYYQVVADKNTIVARYDYLNGGKNGQIVIESIFGSLYQAIPLNENVENISLTYITGEFSEDGKKLTVRYYAGKKGETKEHTETFDVNLKYNSQSSLNNQSNSSKDINDYMNVLSLSSTKDVLYTIKSRSGEVIWSMAAPVGSINSNFISADIIDIEKSDGTHIYYNTKNDCLSKEYYGVLDTSTSFGDKVAYYADTYDYENNVRVQGVVVESMFYYGSYYQKFFITENYLESVAGFKGYFSSDGKTFTLEYVNRENANFTEMKQIFDLYGNNGSTQEYIKSFSDGSLYINGKYITPVQINHSIHYAKIPVTTVIKAFGGKVTWESNTRATIAIGGENYILDYNKYQLYNANDSGSTGYLLVPPGGNAGALGSMENGEFYISSTIISSLFRDLGYNISIDFDNSVVNIISI